MIRIPKLQKVVNKGISERIDYFCFVRNLRVIYEQHGDIHVVHVTDLEYKFNQTFYMTDENFFINGTTMQWIKKKMESIRRGVARERKLNDI